MLVHMNPDELRGIAALAPDRKITTNPVTGQPELYSFRDILTTIAPAAAAIFMPALLPSLSPWLASGIGSGLATTALTGDVERGLISGVMGAALGAAGGRASGNVADAAAASAMPTAGTPQLASEALVPGISEAVNFTGATAASPTTNMLMPPAMTPEMAARAAATPSTFMERVAAPFQSGSNLFGEIMKPKTMLPVTLGAGQMAALDQQDWWKAEAARLQGDREKKRKKARADLQRAYMAANPMTSMGLNPAMGYAAGGSTAVKTQRDADLMASIDPISVQQNLRGIYAVAPPPGFVPGFSPEFDYFQNDPNNIVTPPVTGPADWTKLYADSPLNRFVSGRRYFESILPPEIGVPPGQEDRGKYNRSAADVIRGTPAENKLPVGYVSSSASQAARPVATTGYSGRSSGNVVTGLLDEGGVGDTARRYNNFSYTMGPRNQSFNDALNRAIPPAERGRNPSKAEQFLVENPKLVGGAIGYMAGIPGLGSATQYGINNYYWPSNAWQNPAPPQMSTVDQIWHDSPYNFATLNPQQSGMMDGMVFRPSAAAYGFASRLNVGDQIRVGRGGRAWEDASNVKASSHAGGGRVELMAAGGPVSVAAGGIADIAQARQAQPEPEELQMIAAVLLGQVTGPDADQIIQMFVSKYGPEVFQQVREMILQSVQPGAQTQGMVQGPGGGMDDQVPGMIGSQQPVAVSPGEYIVPADVVSGLGDGSSDAGAQELDRMSQNVRMARGGTVQQPPPIDAQRYMPA